MLCGNDDIAQKAIDLLKETFTNLGPRLQSNLVALHDDFISNCRSRLTVSLLICGQKAFVIDILSKDVIYTGCLKKMYSLLE